MRRIMIGLAAWVWYFFWDWDVGCAGLCVVRDFWIGGYPERYRLFHENLMTFCCMNFLSGGFGMRKANEILES